MRVSSKRRLPVVGNPPRVNPAPRADHEDDGDDGEEARPPWHWVGFGAAAIFTAWLPLAALAQLVTARVIASFVGAVDSADEAHARVAELAPSDAARLQIAILAVYALAVAGGAVAGGYLVGRWGRPAGPREATIAGVVAGAVACALAAASARDFAAPMLASIVLGGAGAALGGWLGARRGLMRGAS